MKLHCLGTAGYHPNHSRHTSCYALPDIPLVLDAGTGFFRLKALLEQRSNGPSEQSKETPSELHILISHAHLDHIVGLTYVYCLYQLLPLSNIHVYGSRQAIEAIQTHLFSDALFPIVPPLQWHPLEDLGPRFSISVPVAIPALAPPRRNQTVQIEWFPLPHPGGSTGYRIDFQGMSFAYITDTTSRLESEYWRRIQGVDWLLHECNFSDEFQDFAEQTGHSWVSAVIAGASAAHVKNLILTHFDPNLPCRFPPQITSEMASEMVSCSTASEKAGQTALPEQVLMATDEMTIELGPF